MPDSTANVPSGSSSQQSVPARESDSQVIPPVASGLASHSDDSRPSPAPIPPPAPSPGPDPVPGPFPTPPTPSDTPGSPVRADENELYSFLHNVAHMRSDTIDLLIAQEISTIYELHWCTYDDLTAFGIHVTDRQHLALIIQYYNQHLCLPSNRDYLNQMPPPAGATLSPIQPSQLHTPPAMAPSTDTASTAVVSLPTAKVQSIPKMSTDYSAYITWRDKAFSVLGHNGWLETIQGEEPLTSATEKWLNNQVFYQLKDATRDMDAHHVVLQFGPQDLYTEHTGDGRAAWKALIVWMEHPQRVALISQALETKLKSLRCSHQRGGDTLGLYISKFNW